MNMEMPSSGTGGRHRLTDTYGRNMTNVEKAYYYSLSPRDALAYDIANVREIYIRVKECILRYAPNCKNISSNIKN